MELTRMAVVIATAASLTLVGTSVATAETTEKTSAEQSGQVRRSGVSAFR